LIELIDRETKENAHSHRDESFYSSYPSTIELKDGCFIWNEKKRCYIETTV
jgi:hypothetical protein